VTDSSGGEKRPNANYKLSKPDDAEIPKEGLTFYYNRENRLAKANKQVQDLYKEKKPNRFGFFGVLVADAPRRILFLTIILMCALIWILSFFGFTDSANNLDGNLIKVSAKIYEDTAIVAINKIVKDKNAYTGAVDVVVSVPIQPKAGGDQNENNFPFFYHRIFFSLEKEERYSLAVPFNSPEFLVVLQTEKKTLKLKISAANAHE